MPKVSVIVPIYKVEKYLRECIDSVLNQSLIDIEVICVDDKSPDNCGEIINKYSLKDNRLKAIHHDVNKGLGAARTTGILNATGEYLYFLDSDDILPRYALEGMYQKAIDADADLVIGDFHVFNESNTPKVERMPSSEYFQNCFAKFNDVFAPQELYSNSDFAFLYSTIYLMVAWMKLFKREIFERYNILAPDFRCAEDFIMVKTFIHNSSKITSFNEIVIWYRKHPDNFTSTRKPYVFDIFKSYKFAVDMYKTAGLWEQEYTNIHKFFLDMYFSHLKKFTPYRLYLKFWWQIHKEIKTWNIEILDNSRLDNLEINKLKLYHIQNDLLFLINNLFLKISYLKKTLFIKFIAYLRYKYKKHKKNKILNTKNISVIVQGAIDKENTPKCLKSIRKYLKGSTIILSTWEGSDISDLDYDVLIENKDPGGFKDLLVPTFTNNTLRQIISTQNGLKAVKTSYVMKIRSDLIFESSHFLKYLNEFQNTDERYKVFNKRIIGCSFFTKKFLSSGYKHHPVPFHISDWILFGLTQDLVKFYDIELPKEPDFSSYFAKNKNLSKKINLLTCSHQYAPEQYIAYSAFSKYYKEPIKFENYMDYNKDNIMLSEHLIANNFIILSPDQFKFYCGKNNTGTDYYKKWSKYPSLIPYDLWFGLYRFDVFLDDYKKYCDKNYKIPLGIQIKRHFEKTLKGIFKLYEK